jgi:hypothetical protein
MKRAAYMILSAIGVSAFILWTTGGLNAALPWSDEPTVITIGKETTFLTEPIGADGFVDYFAALNAPLADLDPRNNAAVLLVQAVGPKATPRETAAAYFRLLKCDPPPETGEYLVDIQEFVERKKLPDEDAIIEKYDRFQSHLWSASEHPLFVELLQVNERPLTLVVEASRRPVFTVPYVAASDSPVILNSHLELVQAGRTAVRVLMLRAMKSVAEGKVEAAYEDVDACHRLANLVGGSAKSVIEGLFATAYRNVALNQERAIAFSGKLTPDALRRRAAIVQAMAAPCDVRRTLDRGERLMALDAISATMRYGVDRVFPKQDGGAPKPHPPQAAAAYDEAMRTVNRMFDELLEALALPDLNARRTAIAKLEADLAKRTKENFERRKTFFLFREARPPHPRGPKAEAGQEIAETLMATSVAAWASADAAQTRCLTEQRQTVLAYALAAHKAEQGRHPEKLNAKELSIRPETLIDPFTDKPFVERVENGKRQVVSAAYDGVIGPKIKPDDKTATAADRAAMPPIDDIVLELP